MLNNDKYKLPDIDLLQSDIVGLSFLVWRPDNYYAVLGASNNPETSLHQDAISEDAVIVQKRPSGGESVLLTPNTLVVSFNLHTKQKVNPKAFFAYVNLTIIATLENIGFGDLSVKGVSDICIGDKKILGCSIYKNTYGILYQSVLNVCEDPALFSKYLKHPEREPDYRKGRNHEEFVTSLKTVNPKTDIETIENEIRSVIDLLIKDFNMEDINAI